MTEKDLRREIDGEEDLRRFTAPQIFEEAQRRAMALARIKVQAEQNTVGHECQCSDCGATTTVPFRPTKGWPVYCLECYQKRKDDGK